MKIKQFNKNITTIMLLLLIPVFNSFAAVVEHSGNISAHTTWANTDVHLITGDVTVASGVILTIEPGTVVKFNAGRRLTINGALNAIGIVGEQVAEIIFTSYRDDSVGGDTNGDGSSQGQAGDWNNIYFTSIVTESLTKIDHIVVHYGGSGNQGNIYIDQSNIAITNSEISNGSSYGVYVYYASPSISNSVVEDNAQDGLYLYGTGSALIQGNTIRRNNNGIYTNLSPTPTIDNNRIINNADWGIYYQQTSSTPVITNNTLTDNYRNAILPATAVPSAADSNILAPNEINGLWILGNNRLDDLQLSILYPGEEHEINTYLIYNTLSIASGKVLTVDPGVVVKFINAQLDINGTLIADGTAAQPIVFTSYRDDRHGGDLNLDGYSSAPVNGDWDRLYFSSQAEDNASLLNHVIVQYGGDANQGNIYADQTHLTISNSRIANSKSYGIQSYYASLTLTNNEIFGNSWEGVYSHGGGGNVETISGGRIFANVRDGIEIVGGIGASINDVEIFGNADQGLRSSSNQALDATGNWWGATDGASGDEAGSGDQVLNQGSGSIDAGSYLADGSEFSYFNAGPNTAEGEITGPTVTQGTDTSEWGAGASTRMLYDLEQVILDYSSLDTSLTYELFVTYYNPDNTSGIGGSIQSLTDANDVLLHDKLAIPTLNATQYGYDLPGSAYAEDGTLRLNFIRENGYRAVVSQVWIVERTTSADTTAPITGISSPVADTQLAGNSVEITGTANDGSGEGLESVEVGIDDSNGIVWRPVTQLNSDGSWRYLWNISVIADGSYTLYSRGKDRVGNLQVIGAGMTVLVNRGAAAAVTDISASDSAADSGGSISLSWTLSADDGTGDNDVTGYQIERREFGTGDYIPVGSTLNAGVSSATDSTAANNIQYQYRIVTIDQAGNRTVSASYGPVIAIDNLGTADNNPPEEITSLATTTGNGFVYLSWTRSIDSALDLIDQTLEISADGGSTWESPISLGKEVSFYLAEGLTNGTGYRFRIKVKDSESPANISAGVTSSVITPSETAYTTVSGTISSNTTWAAGVYYISNNITLNAGVRLTILPGVVVKFAAGRVLTINGGLVAVGTASEPIIFTAFTDDSYGGDTNGDGTDTVPTRGYWSRIQFNNSSDSNGISKMEHVVVQYGGGSNLGNIYMDRANIPVLNSDIGYSSSNGFYLGSSSPLLQGNSITDNTQQGIYGYYSSGQYINNTVSRNQNGIYVQNGTPTVDGNTITDNGNYGIYHANAQNVPVPTNNIITGNQVSARLSFHSLPGVSDGNTLKPNNKNQLEFWGNTLDRSVEMSPDIAAVYYQVGGTSTIAPGVNLEVRPGTIWKFNDNNHLTVNGAMNATGTDTDDKRITFTSYRDDSVGGDTNGDGLSNGQAGDWGRIQYNSTVLAFLTRLEHAVVSYGGNGNLGNIRINQTNIAITNSEISNGSSYGVYVYYASPSISNSVVEDNAQDGLYLYGTGSALIQGNTIRRNNNGIYTNLSPTPTIDNNRIINNADWGIYYQHASSTPVITNNTLTDNYRNAILPATAVPSAADSNILAPNEINGLWILGNNRLDDLQLSILYPGEEHEINTYLIYNTLSIASGKVLTVDPGVVVKFINAQLDINGTLIADGTAAQPIVFTSYRDDRHGGDLNLDGYSSAPVNGDWDRLYFSSQAEDNASLLNHVIVQYGGDANQGNIYADQTHLTISNSRIANSKSYGIQSYYASLTLTNNEIFGNSWEGVYSHGGGGNVETISGGRIFANVRDGIEIVGGIGASINDVEIFGNADQGLRSSSNQALDATGNWWGATDGASGDEAGSGDQVLNQGSGSIDAGSYLADGSEFSYFNAGPNTAEGEITGPTVTQGTDTSEWGGGASTRMLYDLEQVILDYSSLDTGLSYELFITYYNPDNTSGIGGSIQSLTDANDVLLHDKLAIPTLNATQYGYDLPGSAYAEDGTLRLNFIRENGYRAVVSQVWIVERTTSADTTAPITGISSPVADTQLAGNSVEITGTANDGSGEGLESVEVGIDDSNGIVWRPVTQLNSDGSWRYLWNISVIADGSYTLYSRGKDRVGNLQVIGAGMTVLVNRGAAAAVTDISASDSAADSGGSISLSWTLSADDGTGDNDVTGYQIERREFGTGDYIPVGSTLNAGVSSATDSTAANNIQYQYRIVTIDQAGNRTVSASYGPVIAIDNLGTADNNPPEEITSLATTTGNGFVYLSWTRSIDSALDLIDQTLEISADGGSTWESPISLGKEVSFYLAEGLTNGTGYRFRIKVKDSESPANISAGVTSSVITPSETAYTTVSGTISSNTTWAAGVYYISNNITLNAGVRLTILPGVVVKFAAGRVLTINGGLVAVGTASEPIIFTAFTDDSYGGDTNGDGTDTVPTRGYWSRIQFNNSSDSNGISKMEHVVVQYGGGSNLGNIYMDRANIPVLNSDIGYSSSNGFYLGSSSPLLQGNSITDNTQQGIYGYYSSGQYINNTVSRNQNGIYVQNGTPTVDGNTITDNGNYGIYHANAQNVPVPTNNIITGNQVSARLSFHSLPGVSDGNTLKPNNKNQLEFWGNTLDRSVEMSPDIAAVYYQVGGTSTIAPGVNLEVRPGTIWKFNDNNHLTVNGAMNATGTDEKRITFTSYRDDSVGGDTNGDGLSQGQAGDWGRIYYSNTVLAFLTRLDYAGVRFGGDANQGNIYIDRTNITVSNSEISNGSSYGLLISQASPTITGNSVADNSGDGIYLQYSGNALLQDNTISGNNNGIYVYSSAVPTIDSNQIIDNGNWGIYYQSAPSAPVITGNTLTGNYRNAILPATAVPGAADGNTLGPNEINGLWILGNSRLDNLQLSILYPGETHEINTYLIYNTLSIASGKVLTVDPGVVVKFINAQLDINGTLIADGTAAQPIVFTSYRDDRYGGDLNLDGYSSAPANGDWGRLYFSSQAEDNASLLNHVIVQYGGKANQGNIYADQTHLTISNSRIANSKSYGILSYYASLTLTNNEIFGNSWEGVYSHGAGGNVETITGGRIFANVRDGIEIVGGIGASINDVEIFGNADQGLRSSSNQALDASGNWWGATDGASGDEAGSGDQVLNQGSGSIDASGFLADGSEFSYFNAGGTDHYGYGIATPNVTGSGSTEWGVGATTSFLYDFSGTISAEYNGLDDTASYQLLITYLNKDTGTNIQRLVDINDDSVHEGIRLPAVNPVQYLFPLPKTSVIDGNLHLDFISEAGPRTVVSGVYLVRAPDLDVLAPGVTLSQPTEASYIPAAGVDIRGTVSDGIDTPLPLVEVGFKGDAEEIQWQVVTAINTAGEWSFRWVNPVDGSYSLYARATDDNGNQSITTAVNVLVDTVAPAAAADLIATPVGGGMRLFWDLSTDDNAGANDVQTYLIYRSTGNFGEFAEIGSIIAGVAQFDDTSGTVSENYRYFVRTRDLAGNFSDSNMFGPIELTVGSDVTAPEDVTNLIAQATQVDGSNVSVFLTWTASANTAGDLLEQRLYGSRDGITFGNNFPLFDNGQAFKLGRDQLNYQVSGLIAGQSHTFKVTTVDALSHESAGTTVTLTPNGNLAEVVNLGGTLSADTILGSGVYRITSNFIIPQGVRLTLNPGVVFKFNSGRILTVNGDLVSAGSASNPVVFTALTDDSYGGDTNGDGNATTPAPGYWSRIVFNDSSDSNGISKLEHVVVSYAGGNSANIYMSSADIPVLNSEIRNSSHNGFYLTSSSPLLQGNRINDNADSGIFTQYGSAQLINNIVRRNQNGIYVQYGTPGVNDNTITDNEGYGVYHFDARNVPTMQGNTITGNNISILVPASALPDESNVLTPNTLNYIGIRGNDIINDKHLRIWAPGTVDEVATYVVYSANITVPIYKTLTVDPGVVTKFASNVALVVNGALVADGLLDKKIVFTSFNDDLAAGDTNNDGNNSAPVNGQWRGIEFYSSLLDDTSILKHVIVRYGGANNSGNLYMNAANIRVESSEISNSSSLGIRLYNSSSMITGSRIWGNNSHGISVEQPASNPELTFNRLGSNLGDGINISSSANALVNNNQFLMNRGYGLNNTTTNLIDAAQSWWGETDGSGPLHTTDNATGAGDQVSNNVTFEPYLTSAAIEYSYVNFATTLSTAGNLAEAQLIQGTKSDEWDPSSKRSDRTMAYDANEIIVDFSGLDSTKRYKVRVSYYNGDTGTVVIQSLTDGNGELIHPSQIMPGSAPLQYEYNIPMSYYDNVAGDLRLKFVHDNAADSFRAAIPEIWLMEDIQELVPPRFEEIEFNDMDGSGTLSIGDEYYFHFSETMDTSLIVDGSTDANLRLVLAGNLLYGTLNQVSWSADEKTVIVTLTEGFTVTGNELIIPNGLVGSSGLASIGSQQLNLNDSVAPEFIGLDWTDDDTSGALSLGDHFVFHFDEAMNTSVIEDGTSNANVQLRPQGGERYGNVNSLVWSEDNRDLTLKVTDGYTIIGDEQVIPSSFVTDVAGNSVTGTHNLLGKDITPPQFTGVRFDDADGSGTVSVGDSYLFAFDEPMRSSALSDNTTEANNNLSPEGKKYGTLNRVQWNPDNTEVVVEITSGFTVTGAETVSATGLLTDRSGNAVSNTIALNLNDVIAPEIQAIQGKYISPVSATDTYQVTVQFNSSMDLTIVPVITLHSTGVNNPVAPVGGIWLTTRFQNDTFITGDISLIQGMDGTITVDVSGVKDWTGNSLLAVTDEFLTVLDATAPDIPVVNVSNITCDSATLNWQGYAAPADLTSFNIYREIGSEYNSLDGLSYDYDTDETTRSYTLTGLQHNTQYHVAVAAADHVGNYITTIISHPVLIDSPVPDAVNITVSAGNEPDQAGVSWTGYNTGNCGFSGFRVYLEETDFSDVTALTPNHTLEDKSSLNTVINGLDRKKTYYIAVVGFNEAGEANNTVTTASWSDPFTGVITTDLTIGGGEQKDIIIDQTLVVTSNATVTIAKGTTLSFAAGTGIEIDQGKLIVEGTALDPVKMTSQKDVDGQTAAKGDWLGVTLNTGDTGSNIQHLFIEYAQGLHLNGSTLASVSAYTARQNSGAGLKLSNNAALTTTEALLRYNDIGAQIVTGGQLNIAQSVIKNNGINASSDGSQVMAAENNWWGTTDAAVVMTTVTTDVNYANHLSSEPVLTPAFEIVDGVTQVTDRNASLRLASRNADEMRLSEDSSFTDVFYDSFAQTTPFMLSENGGTKTIFAQFRSVTGAESSPIQITIEYVTEGPIISGFNLTEGQVINRPINVSVNSSAVLGLSEIELYVDDILLYTELGSPLNYHWDVREQNNAIHRVKVLAKDNAGNTVAEELNIVIELTPPPAPLINEPNDGTIFAGGPIEIRGSAEPFIQVNVTRNGFVVDTTTADESGNFSVANISIDEGDSVIKATALDSVGISAQSNSVTITLDTGSPAAVVLVSVPRPQGQGIELNWNMPTVGEKPSSVNLYRSMSPILNISQATFLVKSSKQTYVDQPPIDGVYYYVAVGEDSAGNTSPLSNSITYIYDVTVPPLSMSFSRSSPVGAGDITITVTAHEALQTVPSLTVAPAGSRYPVAVILNTIDDQVYEGHFEILESWASGPITINARATDVSGNLFSGTPNGEPLIVDTASPAASIEITPQAPIHNNISVDVSVAVTLDEDMKPGVLPQLQYAPPAGDAISIPLFGNNSSWSGTLLLDSSAGSGTGQFSILTEDSLGNLGNRITNGASLEIYNTGIPPAAEPPSSLIMQAFPAGEVSLQWTASALAESYSIYRTNGDCSTAPTELVMDNITELQFTDLPSSDGQYCYAVTADRRGAASDLSPTASVISDRIPPDAPTNFTVSLASSGVFLQWQAPEGEVPSSYELMRDGLNLRILDGGQVDYQVSDQPDTGGTYHYVVVARDIAGNTSATVPVPLDLLVGAVSNLQAWSIRGVAPLLTWENKDSNVIGYNVFKGSIKLNTSLLTETEFVDQGAAGNSRITYSVIAVNSNGDESPARVISVFPVDITANANLDNQSIQQPLVANYFNVFNINIQNLESINPLPLTQLSLRMDVNGEDSYQQMIDFNQTLLTNQSLTYEEIIPIGNTTEDHLLHITYTYIDDAGNRTHYQRSVLFEDIELSLDMVNVSLEDVPLSGGYVTATLCINNDGYAPMDILVAREQGNAPGDLYISLLDSQGLEIARGEFQGTVSNSILQPNGDLLRSIQPQNELCVDISVLVPAGLDEGARLTFVGAVEHSRHGNSIAGSGGTISGETVSSITLSSYYGIVQVDQISYDDNQVVLIAGQAFNRLTGLPEANAPIKIGFEVKGYKWFENLTTDATGLFSFEYLPLPGLSGEFLIWAAHPDVFDTLNQVQFSFNRVYISPSQGQLRSSKADSLDFNVEIFNPNESVLSGLNLDFRAYTIDASGDEVDEPLIQGNLIAPVDWELSPGEKSTITLQLVADADAPSSSNVVYTIRTVQGASNTVSAVVTLSEAVPALDVISPAAGYVDTSLNRGGSKVVPVTVKNIGLRPLEQAELSLPENITWMSTLASLNANGRVSLGTIDVGEEVTFDVVFNPPADAEFGYHEDQFMINGTNSNQTMILNSYALLTSSERGAISFNVFNIIGQQIEGASVRLSNRVLEQNVGPFHTDASGHFFIDNLNIGQWTYQINAPGHSAASGIVNILAEQTLDENVELFKTLVTVNFNVVPVPYTDKYEIVIEQKFDTHVPVPVLILDPVMTNINNPAPGFEVVVPVKAKNFGLKNLDDITIIGSSNASASWTPLVQYMPVLGPMETVIIPFKLKYYGENLNPLPGLSLPASGCGGGSGGIPLGIDDIANGLWALMSGGYRSIYANVPRTTGANTNATLTVDFCEISLSQGDLSISGSFWCPKPIKKAYEFGRALGSYANCGGGGGGGTTRSSGYGAGGGAPGGPGCFVAGTPITMSNGSIKSIETVQMKDEVLGFNGLPASVTHVYKRETDHLRELHYRNIKTKELHRVTTTDEHLYWVQNNQSWVPAGELKLGDVLALQEGQFAKVEFSLRREQQAIVYNFDVKDYQSYFANDALVYQQCGGKTDPLVTDLLLKTQQSNSSKVDTLLQNKESRKD